MRVLRILWHATAIGILAVLNVEAKARDIPYTSVQQVTSITQFNDVVPTDWAFQALANLVEGEGCVAGYPNGSFDGRKSITRFEAAAVLNACLDRIIDITDEMRRLITEFEHELALIRGRIDALDAGVLELEASQFTTTTKLDGTANFVLNGNRFNGTAGKRVRNYNRNFGATNLLFNLELDLKTSFTGKDLLISKLRTGNFASDNSMAGGGPSNSSILDIAYASVDSGEPILSIDKLFYQFPLGSNITITIGPNVAQDDMLGVWPSFYATDPILNVTTMGGAPMAYNQNQGVGAGITWATDSGWSMSANYVAGEGHQGNSETGGVATKHASGSATVQLAYQKNEWTFAATYSGLQNIEKDSYFAAYATPHYVDSISQAGFTNAFGVGGSWQPINSNWIPSISAGWGINSTSYNKGIPRNGLAKISQSWTIGLEWQDVLLAGNNAGMAVGQPVFVTSQYGNHTPNDGNYVWEWWYQFQISDNISITPALFYLSRPLGQETPDGKTVQQLGGLVMTSFNF